MQPIQEFSIYASFANSQHEVRVRQAIQACKQVHIWTVDRLNEHWVDHLTLPKYRNFRLDLFDYFYQEKLLRQAQRYSLYRAAEQTFPYVSRQIYVDKALQVFLVQPYPGYNHIQIKSRKVWRKYLANNSGLSTAYGMIFPEGDWKETLRQQAGKIPLDVFPYLWHSITLWDTPVGWRLKFNAHTLNSKLGKALQKELKK